MTEPAVPRLASTLLLVRGDPMEVLMVRRNSRGTFASALVFPGGVVSQEDRDPAWSPLLHGADGLDIDECALRIAALRETFEETGILPLADEDGALVPDAPACPPQAAFIDQVRATGYRLPMGAMAHFGHWVTPVTAPKRFDTHFYVMAAPVGQEAACDGVETVEAQWCRPDGVAGQERGLPFPTRMNLARLHESPSVAHAIEAARKRPRFMTMPFTEEVDGRIRLTIPAEAGYPECVEYRDKRLF